MESGSLSYDAPMNESGNHHLDMEHLPSNNAQGNHPQPEQLALGMPIIRKRKGANSTKPTKVALVSKQKPWTDEETSDLLKFVNSSEFQVQRRSGSNFHWEGIVKAMHRKYGASPAISVKRCTERMKTLTGDRYYKLVTSSWERMLKEGDAPKDDDLRKLIESCGLTVEWFKNIEKYKAFQWASKVQGRREKKRQNVTTDRPSTSCAPTANELFKLNQPTSPQCAQQSENTQIAARFNSLNNSQRSTFLDLIFCAVFLGDIFVFEALNWGRISEVCEWLSNVQNRGELAIYEDVFALVHMGLVSCQNEMNEEYDDDAECILIFYLHLSSLKVHQKFFKKVMDRNPAYDTRRIIKHEVMVTLDARCVPSGITILYLENCKELEEVDLNGFQKLRFLSIFSCPKLHKMIGWECLNELRSIEIGYCPLYEGHPPLHKFPSLREFHFLHEGQSSTQSSVDPGGKLDVSGCVCLRRLEINCNEALSSICGLEGLHSLIELDLEGCIALQNLPDLGHMKDLTHLSIVNTSVDEIKGVEKLLSLKELRCSVSKLKTLPDLSHLPHLEYVGLDNCPLTKDPSSPYFGIHSKRFTHKNKHVDVSDTSDTELELSNEDLSVD